MSSEPKVGRKMTDDERNFVRALNKCRLFSGTMTKRFAQQMAANTLSPEAQITERQAAFLRRAMHTFRRQIAPELVALARQQSGLGSLSGGTG